MDFRSLHYLDKPFILCNVWDVKSAQLAADSNFAALGTSSAAIAAALGYPEGGRIPFNELNHLVNRIRANVPLPLTVDVEDGYSKNPKQVADYIKSLVDSGVVGINIEDSVVGSTRTLVNASEFADFIAKIRHQLQSQGLNVFINTRTDSFLLDKPDAQVETATRAALYYQAGADGLFAPCIHKTDDIKALAAVSKLPLNVMCMPRLPDFETLKQLGVKRISMGNFVFEKIMSGFRKDLASIVSQQSFDSVFSPC